MRADGVQLNWNMPFLSGADHVALKLVLTQGSQAPGLSGAGRREAGRLGVGPWHLLSFPVWGGEGRGGGRGEGRGDREPPPLADQGSKLQASENPSTPRRLAASQLLPAAPPVGFIPSEGDPRRVTHALTWSSHHAPPTGGAAGPVGPSGCSKLQGRKRTTSSPVGGCTFGVREHLFPTASRTCRVTGACRCPSLFGSSCCAAWLLGKTN